MNRVRVNSLYRFEPVPWDTLFPTTDGVRSLKHGDVVRVVNQHGCPPANTMGQCYIEKDGVFVGMVHVNSLKKITKGK